METKMPFISINPQNPQASYIPAPWFPRNSSVASTFSRNYWQVMNENLYHPRLKLPVGRRSSFHNDEPISNHPSKDFSSSITQDEPLIGHYCPLQASDVFVMLGLIRKTEILTNEVYNQDAIEDDDEWHPIKTAAFSWNPNWPSPPPHWAHCLALPPPDSQSSESSYEAPLWLGEIPGHQVQQQNGNPWQHRRCFSEEVVTDVQVFRDRHEEATEQLSMEVAESVLRFDSESDYVELEASRHVVDESRYLHTAKSGILDREGFVTQSLYPNHRKVSDSSFERGLGFSDEFFKAIALHGVYSVNNKPNWPLQAPSPDTLPPPTFTDPLAQRSSYPVNNKSHWLLGVPFPDQLPPPVFADEQQQEQKIHPPWPPRAPSASLLPQPRFTKESVQRVQTYPPRAPSPSHLPPPRFTEESLRQVQTWPPSAPFTSFQPHPTFADHRDVPQPEVTLIAPKPRRHIDIAAVKALLNWFED